MMDITWKEEKTNRSTILLRNEVDLNS
uniref:Uncharacterized protein n=1 Tax=Rhizophora mucronata TaxID=61149 RepID=A0A2P2PYT1_RHIMU